MKRNFVCGDYDDDDENYLSANDANAIDHVNAKNGHIDRMMSPKNNYNSGECDDDENAYEIDGQIDGKNGDESESDMVEMIRMNIRMKIRMISILVTNHRMVVLSPFGRIEQFSSVVKE